MGVAATSYACPKCNTENTASVPVVYARETGSNAFAGVGIDGSGDVGVFGGGAKSATGFADKIAPKLERRRSGVWTAIGVVCAVGVIASVAVYFLASKSDRRSERDNAGGAIKVAAAMVVFSAIGFAGGSLNRKANRGIDERNNATLSRWRGQWVCLRCGNQWEP